MDVRKVGVGAAVWFAGIIVPVLQHSLLLFAAVAAAPRTHSIENVYGTSLRDFFRLPWLTWAYVIAMAVVGAALIISGFMASRNRS